MLYVEWLRVRGTLRWTALVLAACVALMLLARFTVLDIGSQAAADKWYVMPNQTFAQFEQISHVTHATLPDGTLRTVVENAKERVRITIDDRGYRGRHIEIFWRTQPNDAHPIVAYPNVGDVRLAITRVPGGVLASADMGGAVREDLGYYFTLGALVAAIVATLLGAPFARENDGHLEIAMTKPVDRTLYAMGTIAVDLAGIVAAWVMTVTFMLIGHSIFEAPNYVYGAGDTTVLAAGLAESFAWYGLLCAATASMKRAYGLVLGIAWPVALIIDWLALNRPGNDVFSHAIHAIAVAIGWVIPFTYLSLGSFLTVVKLDTRAGSASTASPLLSSGELPLLIVLALLYMTVAVVQWRRAEA